MGELHALIASASEAEAEAEALKLSDSREAQLLDEELSAYHSLDGEYTQKKAEARHLEESL